MDNGEILLYAGVMTSFAASSVNDDGKLYTSNDGFNFTYVAKVLDHADGSIWGSGDEIDPLGVFKHPSNGEWWMYYSAANSGWDLGYQYGPSRDNFHTNSGAVLTSGSDIIGGCDPVFIDTNKIAVFIDRAEGDPKWSHWYTEVRTASVDSPQRRSAAVSPTESASRRACG